MSDERQASEHADELVYTLDAYAREREVSPETRSYQEWSAAFEAVRDYIAALEADRARLDWLESLPCGITLPADASYPFIASCTPKGPDWMREFVTRERQARADYAALSPSPLAPTQEGANG